MRLLQVLKTGVAEPGLLLEHGVLTNIRGRRVEPTLTSSGSMLSRGTKYPSLRVRSPVGFRLGWYHIVWYHGRVVLIRVLVIH